MLNWNSFSQFRCYFECLIFLEVPTARFTLARLLEDPRTGFYLCLVLGHLQSSKTIVSSNMILWKFTNTLQSQLMHYRLVKSISFTLLKWQKHLAAFCGDSLSFFNKYNFLHQQLAMIWNTISAYLLFVKSFKQVRFKKSKCLTNTNTNSLNMKIACNFQTILDSISNNFFQFFIWLIIISFKIYEIH